MRGFIEDHFNALALFALFLVLIAGHSFMVHASRPQYMIEWAERLIDQTFTGLLGFLVGQKMAQK